MSSPNLPAVLGGRPVRTAPYPFPNFIGEQEKKLAMEVLDSGILSAFVAHDGPWFNGGRMVKALEAEFCSTFDVRHAVSMNSAASGLFATVVAALAGLGDEVIVPPYTMSATATSVAATNATPIFADIRPDTFCLDPADVRAKITTRTKAIIAVNLFGGPAALDELRKLADEKNLILIEDNAQGPGAKLHDKWAGAWGHMGVFSFNCHKTIQCGEGGVVVTNDDALADRLRLMRNHGEVVLSQRSKVPPELEGLLGFNLRLSELNAAVALAQLRRLEELTVGRIAMAKVITDGLRGAPGITTCHAPANVRHVYYVYPIRIDAEALGLTRSQLKAALDAEGVACADGYVKPIYLYPMYAESVARRATGYGAGLWHPSVTVGADNSQRYERGLCPVTERMHFEELLVTNICRADLGETEAREFVQAVGKVVEHRAAIRTKLTAQGIV